MKSYSAIKRLNKRINNSPNLLHYKTNPFLISKFSFFTQTNKKFNSTQITQNFSLFSFQTPFHFSTTPTTLSKRSKSSRKHSQPTSPPSSQLNSEKSENISNKIENTTTNTTSTPLTDNTTTNTTSTENTPTSIEIKPKKWYDRIPGSLTDSNPSELRWWTDKFVICGIFAITGSSTMFFVRPLLSDVLHLEGSMIEGPWSFRIAYFLLITPAYSLLMLFFSSLFGKLNFFKPMLLRMWSPFFPPSLKRKFGIKVETESFQDRLKKAVEELKKKKNNNNNN